MARQRRRASSSWLSCIFVLRRLRAHRNCGLFKNVTSRALALIIYWCPARTAPILAVAEACLCVQPFHREAMGVGQLVMRSAIQSYHNTLLLHVARLALVCRFSFRSWFLGRPFLGFPLFFKPAFRGRGAAPSRACSGECESAVRETRNAAASRRRSSRVRALSNGSQNTPSAPWARLARNTGPSHRPGPWANKAPASCRDHPASQLEHVFSTLGRVSNRSAFSLRGTCLSEIFGYVDEAETSRLMLR